MNLLHWLREIMTIVLIASLVETTGSIPKNRTMLAPIISTSQNRDENIRPADRRLLDLRLFVSELPRIITGLLSIEELPNSTRQSLLEIQLQIEQGFVPRSENADDFLTYLFETFDHPTPFQQRLRSFMCQGVSFAETTLAEKEIIFTPPDFNAIWLFMLRERIVKTFGPDADRFLAVYRSFFGEAGKHHHLLVVQNNLSELQTVLSILNETFHSKQRSRSHARMLTDPLFRTLVEGFTELLTMRVLLSWLEEPDRFDQFVQEISPLVEKEYDRLAELGEITQEDGKLDVQEKFSEIMLTPSYNTYLPESTLVDGILQRVPDTDVFAKLLLSGNTAELRLRFGTDRFDAMKSFLKTRENSHLLTRLPRSTAIGVLLATVIAPDNFDIDARKRLSKFTQELQRRLRRGHCNPDQHDNLITLAKQYVIEKLDLDSLTSGLDDIISVPPDVMAMINRTLAEGQRQQALEESL